MNGSTDGSDTDWNWVRSNPVKWCLFGVTALAIVCPFVVAHQVDGTTFLDGFSLYLAIGSLSAGILGGLHYKAFKPSHHQDHSGAAVLVWAGGVALLFLIAYLATLISVVSSCLATDSGEQAATVSLNTSDLSFSTSCNGEAGASTYVHLYAVLSPWQTGIGAGIGLLGLAWSTMYKSVYEDRIKTQAPNA
ncbi:MAG: hypothetical protein AAGF71_09300 [Pseudomonadota bacterium]